MFFTLKKLESAVLGFCGLMTADGNDCLHMRTTLPETSTASGVTNFIHNDRNYSTLGTHDKGKIQFNYNYFLSLFI